MSGMLTITISTKGAALVTVAALVGAGTALAVDEVFFDSYPVYADTSSSPQTSPSSADETTFVNSGEQDMATSTPQQSEPATTQGITPAEAMRIGAEATGGRAIDVYPGVEAGRDVFYVDVRTGIGLSEVYVDAVTGDVLKIERGP